jgi:PRTRC genetic system protein D
MDNSVNLVAVDIGCGHTKMAWMQEADDDCLFDTFPSALLPKFLLNTSEWRPKPLALVTSGPSNSEMLTGKDIYATGSNGIVKATLDKNFALTSTYRHLLIAALARQPYDEINTLVLSLPLLTFTTLSERLPEKYSGEFEVNNDRKVFVHNVIVKPQGVSAAQGLIHVLNDMNVIGFDLGSFTLDMFVLRKNEFIRASCESLAIGMGTLVSEILSNLQLSSIEPLSDDIEHRVKAVLLTGDSAYFGTKLYTFNQLLALAPTTFEQISKLVSDRCGEGLRPLPLGGGARIISHALRYKAADIIHVADPEMANVVGMIKMM